MRLVSFSYDDFEGMQLKELNLQLANLIVGKNASGKTRTLSKIERFTSLISENQRYHWWGRWDAIFLLPSGEKLNYIIERGRVPEPVLAEDQIIKETLTIDGKIRLDRYKEKGKTVCKIFSTLKGKFDYFSPPKDQLAIHVRRDTEAYPYFEELISWAVETYTFRFGQVEPTNEAHLSKPQYRFAGSIWDSPSFDRQLFDVYTELPSQIKTKVIGLMKDMGYDITSVGEINIITSNIKKTVGRELYFQELGLKRPLLDVELSSGMYRMFSLLTYIHFLVYTKEPQLIIIDDLGESLDYQRSIKLGKFVFDICQEKNVQLIATSNDGFLMDAVPIEYWNVLRRNGTEIIALNEKNNPQLFENFAFTGLSNFDFFSSDYIDSYLR